VTTQLQLINIIIIIITRLGSVYPRLLALTLRKFRVNHFCFGHFPPSWVPSIPQLFENYISFCPYVQEVGLKS